ncbi:hypothetical protein AsAng_0039540 [Aureispira anguillae]|uniref:Uncharacterized protein n=1 Tax=Aureispira anguillae TaxID=2864201 RepID=A0A916DV69_9BACT|nr:hypothetical protein AsAng_0039540 [Aureispira anguillae]
MIIDSISLQRSNSGQAMSCDKDKKRYYLYNQYPIIDGLKQLLFKATSIF